MKVLLCWSTARSLLRTSGLGCWSLEVDIEEGTSSLVEISLGGLGVGEGFQAQKERARDSPVTPPPKIVVLLEVHV